MNYYHLRVTLQNEDEAEGVVLNFQAKFNEMIIKAVYAYEYKVEEDRSKNHHIHGHILYENNFNLDKIKYYLKTRHPAKYYHQPINKEPENNELYVCKECRIIKAINYTEEQLNAIKQKNEAIEEDKKKDPKLKMIEVLKKKHKNLLKFTMNQLLEEIKRVYILEWDKFPPPQCKALAEYIAVKEVDEYTKNPKYKESPLGDHKVLLVPPLAKSWNYHCERQFQDDQDPDNINWDE